MKCPLCHNEHSEESACPDQPRDSRVGQVIGGKYRVLRKLADGGMGSVYEARHTEIERPFALKFIHHTLAGDEEWLDRFKREARAAGGLVNDHITAVLDFGTTPDGSPYIVMEMLRGMTLSDRFEQGARIAPDEALEIISQACVGIGAAHARGIVHRDIKPDNLFLCDRDAGGTIVKILDFGIARVLGTKATRATKTGRVMGTPGYMSPEQARGERQLDARTDIYALGVILYELLCERQMFVADSYNAILYKVLNDDIPRLEQELPDISPELAAVVHRAIDRDIDARYQQIVDFRADLDRTRRVSTPKVRSKTAPYGVAALDPSRSEPHAPSQSIQAEDDAPTNALAEVGSRSRTSRESRSTLINATELPSEPLDKRGVPMTKLNPLVWIGAMVTSLVALGLLLRSSDSLPIVPTEAADVSDERSDTFGDVSQSSQAPAPSARDEQSSDARDTEWDVPHEESGVATFSIYQHATTDTSLLAADAGMTPQLPAQPPSQMSDDPVDATRVQAPVSAAGSGGTDPPNPGQSNSSAPTPASVGSTTPAASTTGPAASAESPSERDQVTEGNTRERASLANPKGDADKTLGMLTVNSAVAAKLLINGSPVGDVPITSLKLAPGSHRLVAIDNDSGTRVRRTFTVRPGELTLLSLDWSQAVTVKRPPAPPAQQEPNCSPPWTIAPDGTRTPKADCVHIDNPYR